jgi:streptogramin lyase
MPSLARHTATKLAAAAAVLTVALAGSAQAFEGIPNTGSGADAVKGFGHVAGAPLLGKLLTLPFDLLDEPDPAALLGSPSTPEADLADALDALAAAGTAEQATAARQSALDILEGNPIAGRAYSGMPLLNWNAAAKVKPVPAGGTVDVTQVRWGEHMLSDTWLLDFADAGAPYRIRYHVAELGSTVGGQLNPTPLLADGTSTVGGQHSAILPLSIEPSVATGTHQLNRFLTERGLSDVPELTRSAVQTITVDMPPPGRTAAVLDPNLQEGHPAAATLMPASPERVAAATAALGTDKAAAIARLSDESPEKQLHTELTALDPAAVATANAKAASLRPLVGDMRSRTDLPAGVQSDPAADVTLVLQNNEAYITRHAMRLVQGADLKLHVVNRDRFSHTVGALDLHSRTRIFGATDWGEFAWDARALQGGSPTLAAGESRTFTVSAANDAFALWLGDLDSGDQASAYLELDRAVHKQEALDLDAGTTPVHATPDAAGNVWVTLAGVDTIARIRPADRLADSPVDLFRLPGGKHAVDSAVAPLGPADVTVDGRGIVWVTLASGNAIARLDPAQVQHGTGAGIAILKLDPCPATGDGCRAEIPPIPNEQPTRRPTRIKSMIDGQGHTVLWFTETGLGMIGVLRVTEAGTPVNQAHFACGCLAPETLDLGPDGSVWYTQIFENQIGRLRPDATRPYSSSAARIDDYDIPDAVEVFDPVAPGGVAMTSQPLSLAVDGRNRVWFSESALGRLAWLDPARAVPVPPNAPADRERSRAGITQLDLPGSAFRSAAAPADVAVDRANSLWWAGEYGDQIEQIRADDTQGLRFRGSARRGLTEGPVADAQGNLWVVETGGSLVTRISGVTEGPLRPFGLPAGYAADPDLDRLWGARLRDTTSVSVTVQRGGETVASADMPVADGAFAIAGADWRGPSAADPIRSDDTVRIQPHGPFERAPLAFRVADLRGAVQDDGSLAGTAAAGGRALADRVTIDVDGGASYSSDINGGTAAWRVTPDSALPRASTGTVTWSGATIAGTFRTVSHFGSPEPLPDAPAPATGAGDAAPAAPAPAAPAAPAAGAGAGPAAPSKACRSRHWLTTGAKRPTVNLLGMTRAQLRACLGAPTKGAAGAARWTYGSGLAVTFRAGRVAEFALLDGRFGTSRTGAGVGDPLARLQRDLPRVRRDRRTGRRRALVARGDGRYADVAVQVDGRGRIRRITATLRTRAQLDAFGRSLERGLR